MKKGIYTKKAKNIFIKTEPSLNKKELVMVLENNGKKIMQSWEKP